MRRLPPLGAIRAFEAGARHLSFTRAAAELFVTQAAISHQVRQLEDWLGTKLFERRGHELKLTAKGAAYLRALTPALDRISTATESLLGGGERRLRLTVLPSFAACWLVPRLDDFRRLHPEIALRVVSSAQVWEFADDQFDVGIRSGLGRFSGLKADLISREQLSPVCSPAVARTLRSPSDLRSARLLHDSPQDAWSRWLDQAGVEGVDAHAGPSFNDASLVLQAAEQGQGVAMGRLLLAADALRLGRLVQPFATALDNDFSYWLVYPRSVSARPEIVAFRTWLLSAAARPTGAP